MIKNVLVVLLLTICSNGFSQLILDTTYCNFNSNRRLYTPEEFIPYSELTNTTSVYFKQSNSVTLDEAMTHISPDGVTHHIFTQMASGVEIIGSRISIRERNDTVFGANGLLNTGVPAFNSTLTASSALQIILNLTNCYQYKWQDSSMEASLKEEMNDTSATYYKLPELKILKLDNDDFQTSNNYKLVYFISISAIYTSTDSLYTDSVYLVDAVSSQVIRRFSPMLNCFHKGDPLPQRLSPTCTGNCQSTTPDLHYYGSEEIFTERFSYSGSCTYRLKEFCTGTMLYVKHINLNLNSEKERDFRSSSNDWDGGGTPSEKVGATGLWCLEKTHDFYRWWLNRNSFDNNYSQIKMIISPSATERTGWSIIDDYMIVGKWNGGSNYQLTLDIIGHEIGHGVTDKICSMNQDGTIDDNAEEGALSEGYGDIFGQGVEHFVNTNLTVEGTLDDFFQGSNLGALVAYKQRDLANPNNTNNPDTYGGTNWVSYWDGNGPPDFAHTNATVLGHWYYLLSSGGSSTNDNSDDYCVTGIGQYKSLKIAYQSLFYLVGTDKEFADAREATIQAAKSLYGLNSIEVGEVIAAWYAVGVGDSPLESLGYMNIENKTDAASNNYNYNNTLYFGNYTSNNNSNIDISSASEIIFYPNVDIYSSTVDAYISSGCEGGARLSSYNSLQQTGTNNNSEGLNLAKQGIGDITIFPNPTNGTFEIHSNQALIEEVVIYNTLGKCEFSEKHLSNQRFDVNLSDTPAGIYFIKVKLNGKWQSVKVIKI